MAAKQLNDILRLQDSLSSLEQGVRVPYSHFKMFFIRDNHIACWLRCCCLLPVSQLMYQLTFVGRACFCFCACKEAVRKNYCGVFLMWCVCVCMHVCVCACVCSCSECSWTCNLSATVRLSFRAPLRPKLRRHERRPSAQPVALLTLLRRCTASWRSHQEEELTPVGEICGSTVARG